MNNTLQEGIALAKEITSADIPENVQVIVGTPFIHLAEVVKVTEGTKVAVSAQNCASEPKGAFTGEVSANMISSTGARYVIIGHSERRAYYGETNEILHKKVKLSLENNLKPIFCCGEVLEEREANNHFNIVKEQLEEGIFGLEKSDFNEIIIAYEPVWAIGTGKVATPEQAQEMHEYIRGLIAEKYGEEQASETSILYGGSCKPGNAKELFSNKDVDGGLIGGASLKAQDFMGIVNAF